jgi:hypothetical protein
MPMQSIQPGCFTSMTNAEVVLSMKSSQESSTPSTESSKQLDPEALIDEVQSRYPSFQNELN